MAVKRKWDAIVYLVCCVPIGWYISTLLKQLIGRARPVGLNLIALPNEPSLPSGHTVASALFFGAFAVILVLNVQTRGFKKKLITGLVILATLRRASRASTWACTGSATWSRRGCTRWRGGGSARRCTWACWPGAKRCRC